MHGVAAFSLQKFRRDGAWLDMPPRTVPLMRKDPPTTVRDHHLDWHVWPQGGQGDTLVQPFECAILQRPPLAALVAYDAVARMRHRFGKNTGQNDPDALQRAGTELTVNLLHAVAHRLQHLLFANEWEQGNSPMTSSKMDILESSISIGRSALSAKRTE